MQVLPGLFSYKKFLTLAKLKTQPPFNIRYLLYLTLKLIELLVKLVV